MSPLLCLCIHFPPPFWFFSPPQFLCSVSPLPSPAPSLTHLAAFCVCAVSDASRDSTQPDPAGARRPGQQSVLRLCRKSGDHVGVGSSHWLQPDEPAASEPATGTLVQPGQAESTRSEVICRLHRLFSPSWLAAALPSTRSVWQIPFMNT